MSQENLSRLFTFIDGNGNGVIEHADLLGFGTQAGGAAAAKATALWESFSVLDTDGDGRIGKDEFVAGADFESVLAASVGLFGATFDAVDSDGDARISRAEWLTINATLGISAADADSRFDLVDTDGDGYITREEFTGRVAELYRGEHDVSGVTIGGA